MAVYVARVLNLYACSLNLYVSLILKGIDRRHEITYPEVLSYSYLSSNAFGMLSDHLVIIESLAE
jgi:hypothetical protein